MKLTFKYIIVPTGAILFNEATVHIIVAHGFQELKQEILSAGFCTIEFNNFSNANPIQIKCFGESESLKIASKPKIDEIVVKDLFNPVSEIKYFGMNVTELYHGANG